MPLAPGDVLRVSIHGGSELGREAAKGDVDGLIVVPRLYTIDVAGDDLELRSRAD